MGIGGKWPPGKMSTKANGHWEIGANEHFGANGYMGQMGIEGKWVLGQMGIWGKGSLWQRSVLGPMSIGTHRHLGKRAVWSKWANKQMVARWCGEMC